jgi:hypothetical protein
MSENHRTRKPWNHVHRSELLSMVPWFYASEYKVP